MQFKTIGCALALLFSVLLSAQSPDMPADKVFAMKSLTTPEDLDEMATLFRQVTGASSVKVDQTAASIHAWGTLDQMALAAWLQTVLDKPVDAVSSPNRILERPAPGDSNDVAVVQYLPAQMRPQDLQEIVTSLRQVTPISRMFYLTERRVLALRGTPADVAAAKWTVDQIRQLPGWGAPETSSLDVRRYTPQTAAPDDVMVVFIPAHARDSRSVQEISIALRHGVSKRVFTPRGGIVFRGTAAEVARAQEIVAAHDHPPVTAKGAA